MAKKRVLFVDDEENILSGLRRMLRSLRKDVDMEFVESGKDALRAMDESPFDVVVSDMRMPGMDGAQLLTQVRDRFPDTIRIMLSGYATPESIMRTVNVVHQFLAKPCEPENLKNTLHRAFLLRDILTNDNLRSVVSSIERLPSLPDIYKELQTILADPDCSIEDVAHCVSRDIGMSAKVMQLVNSPFFCVFKRVESPDQAVKLLGLDTVKYLALTVGIFSQYDEKAVAPLSLNDLWDHSIKVGACAKRIAEEETDSTEMIDDAFIAGMMHDIGKIVLASSMPEKYSKALAICRDRGIALQAAEYEVFQATHAEIGAYLLGLWGFSIYAISAVAFHHVPENCPENIFDSATAVYVANVLANEKNDLQSQSGQVPDMEYLKKVQCDERLPEWRRLCRQEQKG